MISPRTIRIARALANHAAHEGPEGVLARTKLEKLLAQHPELEAVIQVDTSHPEGSLIVPESPWHAQALLKACHTYDVEPYVVPEGIYLTGDEARIHAAALYYRQICTHAERLTSCVWGAAIRWIEAPEAPQASSPEPEPDSEDETPIEPPPWWERIDEISTRMRDESEVPDDDRVMQAYTQIMFAVRHAMAPEQKLLSDIGMAWNDPELPGELTRRIFRGACPKSKLPDEEIQRRHEEGLRFCPNRRSWRRMRG